MKTQINTTEDVRKFFDYLHNELDLNFHPDDDFCVYANVETKEPTFNDEESNLLDDLMVKCFLVCEAEEKDIYEIAYQSLMKRLEQGRKTTNH